LKWGAFKEDGEKVLEGKETRPVFQLASLKERSEGTETLGKRGGGQNSRRFPRYNLTRIEGEVRLSSQSNCLISLKGTGLSNRGIRSLKIHEKQNQAILIT